MSSSPPQPRIRSLDGLRAISVGLVIFSHLAATAGSPIPRTFLSAFDLGNLGVRVFFVISGFLITTILLREMARTGTINVPMFYLRRTLRIFPPYYLFLAVYLAASLGGWVAFYRVDFAHAVLYLSNYRWLTGEPWLAYPLGHTWSLAIEEQFYLLWPAVLLLSGRRRGLWIALGFALIVPLIRVGAYHLPGWQEGVQKGFFTTADAIATGCILALARDWLWDRPAYRALVRSPLLLLAPILLLAMDHTRVHPHLFLGVSVTAMNIVIAVFLERCVRYPDGPMGRVLNARPIVAVGAMSYSLYLWQQPFLTGTPPGPLGVFPLNLILVFAFAWASYHGIERPVLRLRERLERRGVRDVQPVPAPGPVVAA